MKFFDRTNEIASLREIRGMAKNNAQFTVVTGRRRIGKTFLVWKAYEDEPILYFLLLAKLKVTCAKTIGLRSKTNWESRRWDGRNILPMCLSS